MIEEKIPVTILGQTYEILGTTADALYYNSLARFVEEKMKEILESTNLVSSQKIAVLAALNIADELFRERENKSMSSQSVDKKHDEWIRILDRVLPTAKPAPAATQPEEPLLELSNDPEKK